MTTCRCIFAVLAVALIPAIFADDEIPALKAMPQNMKWAQKWWMPRHKEKLAEAAKRGTEVKLLFIGDSITHYFDKKIWKEFYEKRGAMNLGFSGDRTEQVLWRLRNGEVNGLSPTVTVIMIGTNNTGHRKEKPADTAAGIDAILKEVRERMPKTKILLLAIFPRGAKPDDKLRLINDGINKLLKPIADKYKATYLDINKTFLTETGELTKEIMPDRLHPKNKGYRMWAEAMEPTLKKLMGEE